MTKKEMESAIGNHADWIEHLAGRMDELAAAMARTDDQIAETNRTLKELGQDTDKRMRELGEETDKRIRDLVAAIGTLITRLPQ